MKIDLETIIKLREVTEETLMRAFSAVFEPHDETLLALYAGDRPAFWQVIAKRAAAEG